MEASVIFAKKYLEDILSFFGLNTDVQVTSGEDIIELNIPSTHLNGFLIGQRGETMRSLQFLVGQALKNGNYEITRVNIDVADYKKQRAEHLAERAREWVRQVQESGQPKELQPMNAADRRIVHKVAQELGIISESAGEDRTRHVVLKPKAS